MTDLREAAKAALWAFELHVQMTWPMDRSTAAIAALRAALAQQDEPCPNCASLEAQNDALDRKLAELEQAHGIIESEIKEDSHQQTLDDAMRLPRAMAQAYEAGYKAGVAHEREACATACEHQPHWVACAAAIRARGNT